MRLRTIDRVLISRNLHIRERQTSIFDLERKKIERNLFRECTKDYSLNPEEEGGEGAKENNVILEANLGWDINRGEGRNEELERAM